MKNIDKYVRWTHALHKCKNFRADRQRDRFYFGSKMFKAFLHESMDYNKEINIYKWDDDLRRKYDYVYNNALLFLKRW